jgi:uncharacterized membrane protein
MAKYIQIIGFLLIIIGAVLIALSMNMGWNNNNLISFGSVVLVIAGLITYVFAGKEVLSEKAKEK